MVNDIKFKLISFFTFAFLIFVTNTAKSHPLTEALNTGMTKTQNTQ